MQIKNGFNVAAIMAAFMLNMLMAVHIILHNGYYIMLEPQVFS